MQSPEKTKLEELDKEPSPFVTRKSITNNEDKRDKNDEVTASAAHAIASMFFLQQSILYNNLVSGNCRRPIQGLGAAPCYLDDGRNYYIEPDMSFYIPERTCSNLVVEVANSQSLSSLHAKALTYFSRTSNILIVVTIKIFDNPTGVMLAMVYLTSQAPGNCTISQVVSFGISPMLQVHIDEFTSVTGIPQGLITGHYLGNEHEPCDHPEMPQYTLTIPHQFLLASDNLGQVIAPAYANYPDWEIDLFKLQTKIVDGLRRDRRLA